MGQSTNGGSASISRARRMARRVHDKIVESYFAGVATVLIVGLLGAVFGIAVYKRYFQPAKPTEPIENPFPNATQRLAVLGDSFASGEGARAFWPDSKSCHRAWQTYAYTIATHYQLGLQFPACSGAKIADLDHDSNGAPPQIDAVRSASNFRFVLVQVGGNDAHFGDLVAACLKANFHLGGRCATQTFLDGLPNVKSSLVNIYREVRAAAHGAPVFVMGYPNPFGPDYCTASELSRPDWTFVTKKFIPQLDQTVADAAQTAGVHYIPMLDAFSGFGLCELPVGEAALNAISYLSNLPRHDSFHPNAVGQLLMANRIETILRGSGIDIPKPPTQGPVPAALTPIEDSSPCHAGQPVAAQYPTDAASLKQIAFTGAQARSPLCYRVDGAAWHQVAADDNGAATLNTAAATSSVEIIFRDPYDAWNRSVYNLATPRP